MVINVNNNCYKCLSATGQSYKWKILAPEAEISVSSINTYNKCPKIYELQVVLGMPTQDMETPDSAMNTGKFVYKVAEVAVKMKISTREELDDIVHSLPWRG